MKRVVAFLLLLAIPALPAAADDKPEPVKLPEPAKADEPAPPKADEPVADEAEGDEKVADPGELDEAEVAEIEAEVDRKPVRGMLYRAVLKTGRSFTGVVNGSIYVKPGPHGGWVPAKKHERKAGVRLQYPRMQDGYLFLPTRHIKKVVEVGPLTESDHDDLRKVRIEALKRARSERRMLHAKRKAKDDQGAEASKGEGDGESTDESGMDKIAEYTALLVRFPPGRWNLESPKKIRHRRVILSIAPSEEDIAFLEVFDQWKEAYGMWRKAQKAKEKADAKAKAEATSSR